MNQTTLRDVLRVEGVGLHTGAHAEMNVRPAAPGTGLVFVLRSPESDAEIRVPATAEFALESPLATIMGHGGVTVSTVEHILSALVGMGVVNAEIEVRGPEVPIADGSAGTFVAAIQRIGVEQQSAVAKEFAVDSPFELREGDKAVIVLPSDVFRVRFVAEYDPPIGTQYFNAAIEPATYAVDIAPARTFGYLRDVEAMRAQGLALGGSLDNALVFTDSGPMQPMRWPNEVVRHKVLDLIGDFALLGLRPRCEIIAIKSGHAMHARATRELRARLGVASTT
jgi:UDP-3-O-[3-hydroxymyristoyl] N-acetylglucosamine deacetylase